MIYTLIVLLIDVLMELPEMNDLMALATSAYGARMWWLIYFLIIFSPSSLFSIIYYSILLLTISLFLFLYPAIFHLPFSMYFAIFASKPPRD